MYAAEAVKKLSNRNCLGQDYVLALRVTPNP